MHFTDIMTALIKHNFIAQRYGGSYDKAEEELKLSHLDATIAVEMAASFPSIRTAKAMDGADFQLDLALATFAKHVLPRVMRKRKERAAAAGGG